MRKVFHRELCKQLYFDHAHKWQMYKPESVLEKLHKILLDVQMKSDHPNPTRGTDLVFVNKKNRTCHLGDFAVPANRRPNKKESEKIYKCLDLAGELKKLLYMNITWRATAISIPGTVSEVLEKKRGWNCR